MFSWIFILLFILILEKLQFMTVLKAGEKIPFAGFNSLIFNHSNLTSGN